MFNRKWDVNREEIIDDLFGEEKEYWNIYDDQRPYIDVDNFIKLMEKVKNDSGGKINLIEIIIILILITVVIFVKEPIFRYGAGAYILYWFIQLYSFMSILEGIHIGWDAKRRISEKEIYSLRMKNFDLEEKLVKMKKKKK